MPFFSTLCHYSSDVGAWRRWLVQCSAPVLRRCAPAAVGAQGDPPQPLHQHWQQLSASQFQSILNSVSIIFLLSVFFNSVITSEYSQSEILIVIENIIINIEILDGGLLTKSFYKTLPK